MGPRGGEVKRGMEVKRGFWGGSRRGGWAL